MSTSRIRKLAVLLTVSVFCCVLMGFAPPSFAAEIAASTPRITSVGPRVACNELTEVKLVITGEMFQPGLTAWLTKAGEASVPCYDVNVDWDGRSINCKVWVNSMAAGDWNVVVTNPDQGSATLYGGFTVLDLTVQTVYTGDFGDVLCQEVFLGYLYAGTGPRSTGAHLKKSNGVMWQTVTSNGFGDSGNYSICSLAVLGDYLYVGTSNNQGCEVWRSAIGTNGSFIQANSNGFGDAGNISASSMAVFNGYLYVGTANEKGCEIWRTSNGTTWSLVNNNGFGTPLITTIEGMAVYKNNLYVLAHSSVFRSSNGTSWAKVYDGERVAAKTMEVYKDMIYLGTGRHNYPSCELLRSSDGVNWEQASVLEYGFSPNPYIKVSGMCAVGDLLCLNVTWYAAPYYFNEPLVSGDGCSWSSLSTTLANYYDGTGSYGLFEGSLYVGLEGKVNRVSGLIRPKPTSIMPNSGPNTGIVNVTIRGSMFQAGAAVKLAMAGQEIQASNVVVNDAATITCTFNLKGAAGGKWDVVVTNPDGSQGSLPSGFNVIACGSGAGMAVVALGLLLGLASAGEAVRKGRAGRSRS